MATKNVDWSSGSYFSIASTDLTNTVTFTERTDGEGATLDPRLIHLRVVQGSGALPKVITGWPNNVVFPAGTLPGLSLVAGQVDILQFLEVQVTPNENDYIYYGMETRSNFL